MLVGMARTWWSIRVELVGGRGEYLWPRPGRILIARPGWTFRTLADGINQAFARWDLAHLHAFTLADGTRITMHDLWGEDFGGLDDTRTKLTRLSPGEQFAFTFDFGDDWDHLCTVGEDKVDPLDVAGIVPDTPIPIFGWGDLPDQYDRRHANDDGSNRIPPRPDPPTGDLPPILHNWGPRKGGPRAPAAPEDDQLAVLRAIMMDRPRPWDDRSLTELRASIHQRDLDAVERVLSTHDVGEVAQQAAAGLILLLRRGGGISELICRQAISALHDRQWFGDEELAAELTAALGEGREPSSIPVPVDLDMLAEELDRNPADTEMTWYLDRRDGSWVCDDEQVTGQSVPDDLAYDHNYVAVVSDHGRDEAWHDMALFIEFVQDGELADRLNEAIHGRGAFRNFNATLRPHEEEWGRWLAFSEDRRLGRARFWLELHDLRPAI